MIDDPDRCYRAIESRDRRFDGWFIVAVTSTGIYCRPSCPARTPARANVRFYASAAAAHSAGFRACKRCRPDAAPGSPEWDARADVAGRAMQLVADGVVDREGVAGLAARLGYSARQLQRVLVAEVGAGPLALARAQRARTARVLIETTALPFATVAFAAGFGSVRQFNDTVREVFAVPPGDLRARARRRAAPAEPGTISLRLPFRSPFAGGDLLGFLALRAVDGVEAADRTAGTYRRVLDLPHGPATATVALGRATDHVPCLLRLGDVRDLATAVSRLRRLLDLDADPVAVDQHLTGVPVLGALVRARAGLRVPGATSGAELAARAVLGQQVSVAGARTLAGRLVAALGKPLDAPDGSLTHAFPDADALAGAPDTTLAVPARRRAALRAVAAAVADGTLDLDPGADRGRAQARLRALPGVGPWTAGYVAMRALRDPDVLLVDDLGVRRALTRCGAASASAGRDLSRDCSPWGSYATVHLWRSLGPAPRPATPSDRRTGDLR